MKEIRKSRFLKCLALRAICTALLIGACSGLSLAAGQPFNTTVPGDIMSQFRNQRILWTTNVWVYANNLFGILALIEFTWSAAVMLLEKSDLQTWTAALVRKIMWIGAFYALLINGRFWIPAIIDSFTQMGAGAAGLGNPLNPGDVFGQGLMIAGGLMDSGASSAFFTKPGTSLALIFAAIIIMLSYIIITLNYIVTFVESYLVISVGFIFLGFGGSRWTVPYTERFIGLAVAIGVKILLLYCLISAGFQLGVGWMSEATSVGNAPYPAMTAFDVMGGAVIFMMCCWQIPKLFSAILGGAPALTGGDLVSTGTAIVAGTVAAGSLAAAGVGLAAGAAGAAGGGAAAGGGSGGTASGSSGVVSGVSSARSGGGGSVPPPSAPSPSAGPRNGGSGGPGRQPDPPSFAGSANGNGNGSGAHSASASAGTPHSSSNSAAVRTYATNAGQPPAPAPSVASVGGEPLAGSGFESERPTRGFASSVAPPQSSPRASAVVPSGSGDAASIPNDSASSAPASGADEIASVGPAGSQPATPPASAVRNVKDLAGRVSNKYWRYRNAMSMLPSDAAPHATPPRMPIDQNGE
ncbi:MAG TPA: P-type conjugative transfer protein TrbL [Bryobacteraceae bacterium]